MRERRGGREGEIEKSESDFRRDGDKARDTLRSVRAISHKRRRRGTPKEIIRERNDRNWKTKIWETNRRP